MIIIQFKYYKEKIEDSVGLWQIFSYPHLFVVSFYLLFGLPLLPFCHPASYPEHFNIKLSTTEIHINYLMI